MKKVKITQEQYGKIINTLNESKFVKGGVNRVNNSVKKGFKTLEEDMSSVVTQPLAGISNSKMTKTKERKLPIQEDVFSPEFHQAIHDLIQNIWLNPSQEGLDKALVQYGVTWGDIISYLTSVGVVAAMGSGVYKVKNYFRRKFSKNPQEAQQEKQEEVEKITQMIEKDPKAPWSKNRLKGDGKSTQVNLTKMGRTDAEPNELTPRMSTEESYYTVEPHPDSPEAQTTKNEPEIQSANTQPFRGLAMGSEIAILDSPEGKYAFYYDDIPREELPNPSYQLNIDDVTDYVNKNINNIQKGEGVKDFEQMPLVKIDNALRYELLNLYSKDKSFVDALQKLDETTGAASSGAFTGPMSGPMGNNNNDPAKEINSLVGESIDNLDTRKAKSVANTSKKINAKIQTGWENSKKDPLSQPYVKHNPIKKDDLPLDKYLAKKAKSEEKPLDETTTAGGGTPQASSSGQYTQPKIWAKNKANWAPAQKTQYKGGQMVSFDSCTKLNNNKSAQNGGCGQGGKDHVVKLKTTKDSAIYEQIAKKTGRTIEEVKKLIESKTNKNKSL